MQDKKPVSIILPTYNEAGNINKLVKALIKQLEPLNIKKEIIVVDDNSSDSTVKNVNQLIQQKLPVKLLVRKNQRGLATAILHGINHSTGGIIVIMDADFNHQPKDVTRLLKPIFNKKADLVIGSRYIKGGGMHISEAGAFQFLASKFGNFFVNKILLGLPINESLSGFIAFDRKVLKNLNLKKIFKGYGEYCISLLYKIHQRGFVLTEIPVVYGKRQFGESKSKISKMMVDYFKTALVLNFSQEI